MNSKLDFTTGSPSNRLMQVAFACACSGLLATSIALLFHHGPSAALWILLSLVLPFAYVSVPVAKALWRRGLWSVVAAASFTAALSAVLYVWMEA